jgi:hypothetical protein
MANRAYWQRLSAERNIPALAKRMGWRVYPNSEPASSDKPKPILESVPGGFVSEDELNRRALAESIAYFSSHPELLRNHESVPTADDTINQRHCSEQPDEYCGDYGDNERGPWDALDMGRQASQEELAAVAGALRTLIRHHSRKV